MGGLTVVTAGQLRESPPTSVFCSLQLTWAQQDSWGTFTDGSHLITPWFVAACGFVVLHQGWRRGVLGWGGGGGKWGAECQV